jgi:hypothetical protein
MNIIEKSSEEAKIEMTAGEILTKMQILKQGDQFGDSEDLKNMAEEAGMDFSLIDEWHARNPELSIGQLLEKAGIDPDKKFEI